MVVHGGLMIKRRSTGYLASQDDDDDGEVCRICTVDMKS